MNDEYEHPTPSDGHDWHINFLKKPVDVNCPECKEAYHNHDCHRSPDDGCRGCDLWEEEMRMEELRIDHVQGDVDVELREQAQEKAEMDEYYELHPRPEEAH